MDEERARARAREAIALLTAVGAGGADVTETVLADYASHMAEAAHMLADLPPGDADLKQRFLLLLDAIQDATTSVVAPLAGFVGVTNVLLLRLSAVTGKSQAELLQDLALYFA
jgi:hypothetical protein